MYDGSGYSRHANEVVAVTTSKQASPSGETQHWSASPTVSPHTHFHTTRTALSLPLSVSGDGVQPYSHPVAETVYRHCGHATLLHFGENMRA